MELAYLPPHVVLFILDISHLLWALALGWLLRPTPSFVPPEIFNLSLPGGCTAFLFFPFCCDSSSHLLLFSPTSF